MARTRVAPVVAALAGLTLAATGALIASSPAHAAALEPVTGFGTNPGNLTMHSYRPDGLPSGSPVVVALHGCTQSASTYHDHAGWRSYADQWGFALIYPEQPAANQPLSCFRWFENAHIQRGQGEAHSIAQMVQYAVSEHAADPDRVYVTGLSAGGAMSAVMLATYPDLFAGGSVMAGLPYRCAPPNSTTTCQYIGVDQTPQQWGALVRDAYPGYAGPRPKVAIWHGTSDTTVTPANATELVEQWTDVAGVPATPTGQESLPGNTTLDHFGDDDVRRYLVGGAGHGQPVDPGTAVDECGQTGAYFLAAICAAYHDAVWFGLAGGPPPTATPSASPTSSPSPTPDPVCVTADNYAHTQAGRAFHTGGHAYAVGSEQDLGLWNTFVTTSLRQTGPDYWVLGC